MAASFDVQLKRDRDKTNVDVSHHLVIKRLNNPNHVKLNSQKGRLSQSQGADDVMQTHSLVYAPYLWSEVDTR